MQLTCPKCARTLEFATERPSFCSHCGNNLRDASPITSAGEATLAPGESPKAQEAPLPGNVNGYSLVRRLGEGGMGTVYEAVEQASGRRVALKLIAAEFARSAESVDRFRQEGRLASMVTHPRCVFVLGVDEDQGRPFIVMELMAGPNLQDLVKKNGPLAVDDAIAKILDVMEGLHAAHRLEVIHRDVKPSNCFLEGDGRVKVGDFGLAKSLVREGSLTRTGAFVGTVFFASPEQLRGEPLDPRTDVYSVAGTLYYLLMGKAPFQGSDPGSALARIVSEPAPPMRRLRPDIPAALDRIVLRGLERNRDERWPDLDSFRQAILSLIPVPLTAPTMLLRTIAGLVDGLLLLTCGFLLLWLAPLFVWPATETAAEEARFDLLGQAIVFGLGVLYFTIAEWGWGYSLGKKLMLLQVAKVRSDETPTLPAAALRSLHTCALLGLGPLVARLIGWANETYQPSAWIPYVWSLGGVMLMVSTMRPKNGFRGLHELLSGTRVLQYPWPRRQQKLISTGPWLLYFLTTRRLDHQLPQRQSFPDSIGGFLIRGIVKWTPEHKILLGEDPSLGRRVFLWMRPGNEPELDAARRHVGRRTRLRWLGSGTQADMQWDALLAPLGCPLPDLVHNEGPLSWPEAKVMLIELTEELAAATADGTLPIVIRPDLVWVQPDGRAQLTDIALVDAETLQVLPTGDAVQRCWHLLAEATVLALVGNPSETTADVMTAVPKTVQPLLSRLFASPPQFKSLEEFVQELRRASE